MIQDKRKKIRRIFEMNKILCDGDEESEWDRE